jgi:hypothetical protein
MDLTLAEWLLALALGLAAGVVKGLVGFGMPLILMTGLTLVMPPPLALAGLILPTLATNGVQALGGGWAAVRATILRFRLFLLVGAGALALSGGLVLRLEAGLLFLLTGLPVTAFALMLLCGWQPRPPRATRPWEAGLGAISGFLGGFSGIWGPPTVIWLTALGLEKTDHIRAQGVIYGLGALALALVHLVTGVLNAATLVLSAALTVPALAGLWLGQTLLNRVSQAGFRRAVLVVLLVAGLNLIRRGLGG